MTDFARLSPRSLALASFRLESSPSSAIQVDRESSGGSRSSYVVISDGLRAAMPRSLALASFRLESSPSSAIQVDRESSGGEVDRGHAAGTEFVLDGVAVREGGAEAFEDGGHRRRRCDFRYDRAGVAEFGALLGHLRKKGRSEERPSKKIQPAQLDERRHSARYSNDRFITIFREITK